MSTCKQSRDTVKHLIGTPFVPSVVTYIQEMTGIKRVGPMRPTREGRYCEVEYELKNGMIIDLRVAPCERAQS